MKNPRNRLVQIGLVALCAYGCTIIAEVDRDKIPDVNTAIVSRGDNLWRISHRIYGRGVRYTVIYGANQRQIRNPHRIYPGQVFVLPGEQSTRSN